jgi:hypothetical protein
MGQLLVTLIVPPIVGVVTYIVVRRIWDRDENGAEAVSRREPSAVTQAEEKPNGACAKLATKPPPTGSAVWVNTIGTVLVTWSNVPTTVPPEARMRSGASETSSAANLRVSAALPADQRVSMLTLRPSVQPNSCKL